MSELDFDTSDGHLWIYKTGVRGQFPTWSFMSSAPNAGIGALPFALERLNQAPAREKRAVDAVAALVRQKLEGLKQGGLAL
jgi:hypothetical protein